MSIPLLGKEKGVLKNKKKQPDVKVAYVIMVSSRICEGTDILVLCMFLLKRSLHNI